MHTRGMTKKKEEAVVAIVLPSSSRPFGSAELTYLTTGSSIAFENHAFASCLTTPIPEWCWDLIWLRRRAVQSLGL